MPEHKSGDARKPGDAGKEAGIAEIMKSIDSSPGWKESVQKKAAKKGISYEEMLRLDATWTWEQKQKK